MRMPCKQMLVERKFLNGEDFTDLISLRWLGNAQSNSSILVFILLHFRESRKKCSYGKNKQK